MLVPKLLRIEGFRGFTQAREFRFDNPATILYGQNHSGKSSTLNALEWCLFGKECSGKSTGIRERIGWIVANRHIAPPNVSVQLVLENAAGKVIIQRRLRNEKRKQVEELSVCKPDGEELRKEEAERYLAHLLRTTFRDFSTTTYQHQENIRAILTQEPKERDDAIDRLLGLSIYRNLLETMSKAKAKEAQKKLEQKFEGFEREVTAALATREQDMESLQQQAEDLGISGGQQNEEHALDLAKQLVNQLKDFARELGIEPRELEVPATWQLLGEFAASTKDLVTWLRSEMPALKEQQNLYQKELTLSKLQADLQERETEKSTISKQLFELESTYGNVESAKNQIQDLDQQLQAEQLRLRQTDAKAALIKEALEYFDLGTSSKDRCPLCDNVADDLEVNLREQLEQQLEENTRVISDGIKELNECRRKLAQIIDQYNNLSRSLATISSLIDQLRLEAGKKLVKNIASKDDVQAVLKKETLSLQDWQKRLSNLIAEKQERLTEFENRLGNIKIIGDIIQLGEKRKNLEQIQQSPAFLELEAIRDEIATWVADLEAIQQAISMASQKEAQGKVQAAEKTIDNFFRKLTQHPAVSRIHLNVQEGRQGRNTYDISDGQGGDLTPLLSQGDLNALALAIFLGLTVTGGEGFPLGFVILDDPSQSLGSEYKRRLAQVLNEICEHKEVLIATMDQEFCGHIKERMTKNKTEYLFGEWTPEAGPTITRGK